MTDLLHALPEFPTNSYTHLLPSLERQLVTTTDLITLDALEIARRAQLPLLDVRKLANHVIAALHGELGFQSRGGSIQEDTPATGDPGPSPLKHSGKELVRPWTYISTLDLGLDALLGGGIPPGYVTEIVGERYGCREDGYRCIVLTGMITAAPARHSSF